MHHHRFTGQLSVSPRVEDRRPAAQGFVLCPLALQQGWQGQRCPWQEVYQLAYEQARAVVLPSRLERCQAVHPN